MYFKPELIGNRIRIIKCDKKGNRIGKMFAIFPMRLRTLGVIYKIDNVKRIKKGSKFCWNCMGLEIAIYRSVSR